MEDVVAIRKDVLSRMLARKQIGLSEYLAGREWQGYLEAISIQASCAYDWETSIFLQPVFQGDGDWNDVQTNAFDVRRILTGEIGRVAADDLDRVLSLPDGVRLKLSEHGAVYIARLLQIVSVALDISAGGTDFGAAQEDWERPRAEDRVFELRKAQPWLFDRHRQQPRKPSAAEIMGRYVR